MEKLSIEIKKELGQREWDLTVERDAWIKQERAIVAAKVMKADKDMLSWMKDELKAMKKEYNKNLKAFEKWEKANNIPALGDRIFV